MAVFKDGTNCPIQSVSHCPHEEKDAELFRVVAPKEAMRVEIKAALDAERWLAAKGTFSAIYRPTQSQRKADTKEATLFMPLT